MAFGRGPSGVYEKPKRSCPTVVLPPIGPPASASAQAAEPVYKSKRRRKPKSLEDLGRYTATSGCYELIDELMQSVLLERPAAVLPHLVQHCREKTALSKEDRAQLEHKFEQGKLLSAEEMDALRNGSAHPVAAEAFRLLSRPLPDTRTGHRHRVGPLGAAGGGVAPGLTPWVGAAGQKGVRIDIHAISIGAL